MSSAISALMPRPRLREVDRIAVAAGPDEAWRVVRAVDLYALPLARRLLALRAVPEQLGALFGSRPRLPVERTARLDEIVAPGNDFHLLAEREREWVAGAVGKFWKTRIPFAPLPDPARESFAAFSEPGFGRVAWSLLVHPHPSGGSWVEVDLRVDATDDAAWHDFRPYWVLIGRFSHAIRTGLLRRIAAELGAAPPDAARAIVGDELLPNARVNRTDAVTIEAPPAQVWPWLVQMGCRRAGWYSIDLLDNGGVPSADRIVPELQALALGDILPATPKGADGFAVLRIESERALVLGSPSLLPDPSVAPHRWGVGTSRYDSTWAFALEPIGDEATHLVVRVRAAFEPSVQMALAKPAILAAHSIMEHAQLRNLKHRCE